MGPRSKSKAPRNIALCVPAALIDHTVDDEGNLFLLVPRFRASWMQWLQKRLKKPHIKVKLDEIGAAVWLLMDRRRTVHEIGRELEKQFGQKIQPLEQRLGLFMGALRKNRFVALEEHGPPTAEREAKQPS